MNKNLARNGWVPTVAALVIVTILSPTMVIKVEAHGHLISPRSRNWFAWEEGVDGGGVAGLPPKEFCTHCLNTNNGVCGKTTTADYDEYLDSTGVPMPWDSQETFTEGQEILVKSYLDTHHNGHMVIKACPNGPGSTQACFDTPGHELTFVKDTLYDMPADPAYPERGYYAGGQAGGLKNFEMTFKLPVGISGNQVMLQWKYITANSCSPPGYSEYFAGANSAGLSLPDSYWTTGVTLCTPPYPSDGTRSSTWPEQFFNCAEISVLPSQPTVSPSPTSPPVPTPPPVPTVVSTNAPTKEGCCSWGGSTECSQPENRYCQESKSNCEGNCSGTWLGGAPPSTPAPIWTEPSPVPPANPTPVSQPTTATGCCSINFKTCHHDVGTFCWESESNCVGECGKYWLPSGPIDGCTAQWDPCTNDAECCGPATCADDGVCRADGWNYTPAPVSSPVLPVTPAPVSSPVIPVTPAPVSLSPVSSPSTKAPTTGTTGTLSCSASSSDTSWYALLDMEPITYEVSPDPYTLSVIASGGAAGDGSSVVTESQAYGVMVAALALASLNENHANYDEAKMKFLGYFNGWKKMCENSSGNNSPCQSVGYCNEGKWPCLPGWKHDGDLGAIVGTGAAPDGDEDAIAGMIIAVKAVEDDAVLPPWYDEVRDWADRSCTQFLEANTILSPSKSHRILKLGSCWGGWGSQGNNPSYHAPGHYRMMRDFQSSFGARSYTVPSFGDSLPLTEKWNMLIDTSYKFLETTQCPDSGLVPNWALVEEVDSQTLSKASGSFSGSGTPQYEFGAEASRTMWRVAFDAAIYPEESADQARSFLAPLHDQMIQNYDNDPVNGWEYFGDATLASCPGEGYVSNVFGSWMWNGFIFGPVYSTLVSQIADESFQGRAFTQQNMVDAACDLVSDRTNLSYYPRSWLVISAMTLNGDLDAVRALVSESPEPTTPSSPTFSPTKIPTMIPTSSPTMSPTSSPTSTVTSNPTKEGPVNNEYCCTWDFFHCGADSWCNESMVNCQSSCGGAWIRKMSAGMQCIGRWGECTGEVDRCCEPLTCNGNEHYKQCL